MANLLYNKEGPWGGESECVWTDGTYSDIKSITVTYGDILYGIQVDYLLKSKSKVHQITAPRHGGKGSKEHTISLANKYLKGIEGKISVMDNHRIITSLTFITSDNKRHGPYGSELGSQSFKSSGDKMIVGFYGRAGTHLNNLGIYTLDS
ncbi:hypothetical protein SUGI_0897190 [Cryptomeria japonica]|uniref:agglutinin-like n=1 Tax=Cryptomeria japonica TaxID=3369 RepID=UPI002414A790|nr:agglutinin-like [Cryptomeria japonica]GLJ43218.1 hypothetical protein SUGI_0897190 [Cryptomeria japonica]